MRYLRILLLKKTLYDLLDLYLGWKKQIFALEKNIGSYIWDWFSKYNKKEIRVSFYTLDIY
jgi:hypothetical protein